MASAPPTTLELVSGVTVGKADGELLDTGGTPVTVDVVVVGAEPPPPPVTVLILLPPAVPKRPAGIAPPPMAIEGWTGRGTLGWLAASGSTGWTGAGAWTCRIGF